MSKWIYHLYCERCGHDWWSEDAFPEKCPNCGSEHDEVMKAVARQKDELPFSDFEERSN